MFMAQIRELEDSSDCVIIYFKNEKMALHTDFLLDDSNLMELRNRNIDARLLDRQRIDDEKKSWQWINLLFPLAIIGLLGGFFYWWRKRKFG